MRKLLLSRLVNHDCDRTNNGFTLIEIIVVVAIIGTIVATLGVKLSNDEDRWARIEAKRFISILNEVRDEAIIVGKSYALQINKRDNSYLFLEFGGQWKGVSNDTLFKRRQLRRGVSLSWEFLERLGTEQDDKQLMYISPLGEITNFEVRFTGNDDIYYVFLDSDAQLSLRQEKINGF